MQIAASEVQISICGDKEAGQGISRQKRGLTGDFWPVLQTKEVWVKTCKGLPEPGL